MEFWEHFGDVIAIIGTIIGTGICVVIAISWILNKTLIPINSFIQALAKVQEIIIAVLSRAGLIKKEEYEEIHKSMANAHASSINATIGSLKIRKNPFSKEEIERLEGYRDMLIQGKEFTSEEARNFHELTQKLKEERPNDEGTWVLVALGASLLGLYLGSNNSG